MRPVTIAVLVDRIDVLAYHVGVLELENAALRRAIDRAEAAIDHDRYQRAAPPKPAATPTPILRDWAALGTITRRRIA